MTAPKLEFEWKVNLGSLIQVILLIGALFAGWAHFAASDAVRDKTIEQTVTAMEGLQKEAAANTKGLQEIIETEMAFPPHRHADHVITYPDGHVEQMPK